MAETPSTSHGAIVGATISTPDLAGSLEAWRDVLGYDAGPVTPLDADLAAAWNATDAAGLPSCLLTPASVADFTLRLVESPRPASCAPRRAFGWAALELTVRDADALHARLAQEPAFSIIASPAPLAGLDAIYPMQAIGPADEVLYLNEIRGDLENVDLPRAMSEVDHAFIVVLGAPDIDRAEAFYRQAFGFQRADAYAIPYKVINHAFDLPAETTHRLVTTRVGRRVNVEIDQYPEQATPRATPPGMLPPAIAMVSFTVDDLASIDAPFFTLPVARPEAPYRGRRAATVRGPAGELIELIESAL